ncbi:MAG: hypothetical protein AAF489_11420 [Bacteroidota bacterium]
MCKKVYVYGNVWCDDQLDLYIGNEKKVTNYILSQNYPSTAAFEEIAVSCCDYFYFVCWSNDVGRNGFLAELHGANTVLSGSKHWQVYATGADKDFNNDRPSQAEINQFIRKATCEHAWQHPTVGQKNQNLNVPFPETPGIDQNANFIWYDSGNDSRNRYPSPPYVPFVGITTNVNGPTHDEFLIFRIPVHLLHPESCQDCNCCEGSACCSKCSETIEAQESTISERAQKKSLVINAEGNNNRRCHGPYSEETCSQLDIPKIEPCFYLNFGDSNSDQLEEHDTEVAYLTICNPYRNMMFKGLTITEVILSPSSPLTPNGELALQIVPDKLVHFSCLKACSCLSREFAIMARGIPKGTYTVEFKYCVEEVLVLDEHAGSAVFEIDIVRS